MKNERNIGQEVVNWFNEHVNRDDGSARATRARLKRCNSAVEALAVSATHDLNGRLKELKELSEYSPSADQLAAIAITFSHLKSINGKPIAVAFGTKSGKDGPRKLSELRFQSLIRVQSHRELIASLRRAMAVLQPELSCNGWKLAEDIFWWGDDNRRRWCLQYFGAGIPETKQQGETHS